MRRLLDVNTQLGADEADVPVERPADVQAVRTSDWHGPDKEPGIGNKCTKETHDVEGLLDF